jgi:ubiquinone/menaquinone biosynthesis C-methylase UbiE
MSGSLSFDRAADYYDRTRGLSDAARREVIALVAGQIAGRVPILEVGVGTGRMALPLAAAGVDVVGIDLSHNMLLKLTENGAARTVPAARADAVRLPFADNTFAGAYSSHVLHLIPPWRAALGEIVRVVAPGGFYLNDMGGWRERTEGPETDVLEHFLHEAGASTRHVGANHFSEVDEAMAALGATVEPLPTVTMERVEVISEIVDNCAAGRWSITWQISADVRRAAAAATLEWARERFGDVDRRLDTTEEIRWRAYQLR